jgi:hypothetical protein
MSVRQRIIQILRENDVADPAAAIRNWQQSMGIQIGQNDDAEVIAGLVLDTVDYAGAADRAFDGVRAPIPTMTDTLMGGGGGGGGAGGAPARGATYQAVREILRQHFANPDAAIGIFMQSAGVQSFQGFDAAQVAQAILDMQFPQRVAGRAPGPNAAAAAELGMTQDDYALYLAAQMERQATAARQATQRQAAQRQAAQRQAAQRQEAQRLARQAAAQQASKAASGGGGGGAAPAQQLTQAQRQFQQILKRQRWADKLTLQKLRQYVATRKSTLQKLLDDVKRDESVLNKVVVAMSYNR